MILTTVVQWIHIFGAIGWLGGVLVFGIVIGPAMEKFSAPTRGEFVVSVVPRFLRFIGVFSVLTVVFGVVTVAAYANGDYSIMSLSTSFGLYIATGAILSLVAIGIAMVVVVPSSRKIVKIAESLMKNPGPPPPELIAAARRLRTGSLSAMVILIVVTMFMVAAAT
jgi:uncharacterized membrane protein